MSRQTGASILTPFWKSLSFEEVRLTCSRVYYIHLVFIPQGTKAFWLGRQALDPGSLRSNLSPAPELLCDLRETTIPFCALSSHLQNRNTVKGLIGDPPEECF